MTEQTAAPPAPPASAPRTTRDVVYGLVGGAAVFLALVFALVGGEADGAAAGAPPEVTVLEPESGSIFSGRVTLVFRTPEEMVRTADGWQTGGSFHLHALVDGTELMAAPGEVQPLGGGRYRWTLPALPAGEHRLRLTWAGPDHRTFQQGGSSPFTVVVH